MPSPKQKRLLLRVLYGTLGPIARGKLPDFLIIGAQKSATSSLHYYLNQHPYLYGSYIKELNFFSKKERYRKGVNYYRKKMFNPFKWVPGRNYLYFESSPSYLYQKGTAAKIKEVLPQAKIIISLRNPVERAYSAWNMYKRVHRSERQFDKRQIELEENNNNYLFKLFYSRKDFPSFEKAAKEDVKNFEENVEFERPGIVRMGIYYPQVKKYLELFGRSNTLILGFKEITKINQREKTLNKIADFVGVSPMKWDSSIFKKKNVGNYKRKAPEQGKRFLEEFYKPHNQRLFQLIGEVPDW